MSTYTFAAVEARKLAGEIVPMDASQAGEGKLAFTLRRPIDHADEATLERMCLETVRFLAAHSDGVYQIDGQGWFAADGTLLLQEY